MVFSTTLTASKALLARISLAQLWRGTTFTNYSTAYTDCTAMANPRLSPNTIWTLSKDPSRRDHIPGSRLAVSCRNIVSISASNGQNGSLLPRADRAAYADERIKEGSTGGSAVCTLFDSRLFKYIRSSAA